MTAGTPDWLKTGRGAQPAQRWSFAADARLTDLRLARESGDVLAADESGGLYLLDRRGRVVSLTRTSHTLRLLAFSDTGQAGAAVVDESEIVWIDARLQFRWKRPLPDDAVGLAMDAHGTHVVVTLANGQNIIYDADKKKVATFESLRPLRFVQFLTTEPGILAAADYGFFARYTLLGQPTWSERLFSTVADLSATGDGGSIVLAGLACGLQVFDEDGAAQGSFVLDGTAHLASTTFLKKRIAAATMERQVLCLDAEGSLKWLVHAPDDVVRLQIAPLGDWVVCGFAGGRIVRLDNP